MAGDFHGFTPDTHEFFAELEQNNNREWFQENRQRFHDAVRDPFEALLAQVADEFGSGRLFRLNRDIRFSRDKSPYKLAQGAVVQRGCAAYYMAIDADGVLLGAGAYDIDRARLETYREAVAGEPGEALVAVRDALQAEGYRFGSPQSNGVMADTDLKRVPRPYPADHPRGDLLRLKRLAAMQTWERPAWLCSDAAVGEVTRVWKGVDPLMGWIEANIGDPTESSGR